MDKEKKIARMKRVQDHNNEKNKREKKQPENPKPKPEKITQYSKTARILLIYELLKRTSEAKGDAKGSTMADIIDRLGKTYSKYLKDTNKKITDYAESPSEITIRRDIRELRKALKELSIIGETNIPSDLICERKHKSFASGYPDEIRVEESKYYFSYDTKGQENIEDEYDKIEESDE